MRFSFLSVLIFLFTSAGAATLDSHYLQKFYFGSVFEPFISFLNIITKTGQQ